MGYTHFNKVSGEEGLAVGVAGSEIVVAGSTGQLYQSGVAITATAAELNAISGGGLSAAELGFLDGALAGTQVASKAVIADANVNTGVSKVTQLHIGASGSEVQVTATAAELNITDTSVQTETGIAAAGVASVTKRVTKLDSSGGAGAFTLAAPDASMLGQVKVIEMTVAGNALTLSLANVQGGSAATTASFDAVNETLVLVAGTNKWTVLAEAGVTLS